MDKFSPLPLDTAATCLHHPQENPVGLSPEQDLGEGRLHFLTWALPLFLMRSLDLGFILCLPDPPPTSASHPVLAPPSSPPPRLLSLCKRARLSLQPPLQGEEAARRSPVPHLSP